MSADGLCAAASQGDLAQVKALLAQGADLNYRHGWTALHWAARYGHEQIVQLLLVAGAKNTNYWWTALHKAAGNDHLRVARVLLDAGAPPTSLDEYGYTVLHEASQKGCADTIWFLISAGAEIEACDRKGNTALHMAARNMNMAAVMALLAAGADPTRKNSEGHDPIDVVPAATPEIRTLLARSRTCVPPLVILSGRGALHLLQKRKLSREHELPINVVETLRGWRMWSEGEVRVPNPSQVVRTWRLEPTANIATSVPTP